MSSTRYKKHMPCIAGFKPSLLAHTPRCTDALSASPEVLQVQGGPALTPLHTFPQIPALGLLKAVTVWFDVKLPLLFQALDHPGCPPSALFTWHCPQPLMLRTKLPSASGVSSVTFSSTLLSWPCYSVCSSCPHPKPGTRVLSFCQLQT